MASGQRCGGGGEGGGATCKGPPGPVWPLGPSRPRRIASVNGQKPGREAGIRAEGAGLGGREEE